MADKPAPYQDEVSIFRWRSFTFPRTMRLLIIFVVFMILVVGYVLPKTDLDSGLVLAFEKYGEEGVLFTKDALMQAQVFYNNPKAALLGFHTKLVSIERTGNGEPCHILKKTGTRTFTPVTLQNTYEGEIVVHSFFYTPLLKVRISCDSRARKKEGH